MKKNTVLTLSLCVLMIIPLVSHADYETKVYSYNELSQMSDEEFAEIFKLPNYKDYSEYYFGDASIPDEKKFEACLNKVPEDYIGSDYHSVSYSAYLKFMDAECTPYITFTVDRYTKLDKSVTAETFGYPKDWKITAYDGVFYIGTDIPRQLHEYRIEVPLSVISDFEQFIRLESSYDLYGGSFIDTNQYGITGIQDIYHQFASYGNLASNLYGDANCDYIVNLADTVLVMQAMANPEKYGENGTDSGHISTRGIDNADMDGDGITNMDALTIQRQLLGLN